MRFLPAFAIIAASFATPVTAQMPAATAPASLIREGVTEKITPHVWAIPDGSAPAVPNVGIVVGSKAVLVVDTGMGPRNGRTVLKEVAKVAPNKPIYIVTTHVHPEHDLGASAFPKDARMIRSKDQVAEIAANGLGLVPMFAQRSALNAELLKDVAYRPADITFDKEYTLDLGGVTAKIYAMGLNHTPGDTVINIEEDRVLFSGDLAMRPQPSIMSPQATITQWLDTLNRLEMFKPIHVIPSHGPRGDIQLILGYRSYLTLIRDRATKLKGEGKTLEQTTQAITDEMSAKYPDKQRLAGAIRAAYAETK